MDLKTLIFKNNKPDCSMNYETSRMDNRLSISRRSRFIKSYHVFFIIILSSLLSSCSSSRIPASDNAFFFIQMADPQFGMFTENKDFTRESRNFEKAIEGANRLKPSFVIVCGDLVNQANNPSQMAEYKRISGKIDPSIPIYAVPGNHDIGNQPSASSLADYRKNFGADYYSFKSGNLFGIVLNSSLFKDPTLVEDKAAKQDQWLKKTLKEAKEKKFTNIVVFQHIPFFLTEPNEKDGYFNIPLERRMKYLELFDKYGVKYIFAGHLHKNSVGNYKGIEMVTTGPVGKPLGKDPSGFRIVTVSKNKIEHQYYSLDSIPSVSSSNERK